MTERKNGQAMPLEEYTEKVVRQMCERWYKRGFRDGKRAAERKLEPNKHYCRECAYWNGERSSVGVKCTNPDRPWWPRNPKSDVHKFKAASNIACRWFKGKEDWNTPNNRYSISMPQGTFRKIYEEGRGKEDGNEL